MNVPKSLIMLMLAGFASGCSPGEKSDTNLAGIDRKFTVSDQPLDLEKLDKSRTASWYADTCGAFQTALPEYAAMTEYVRDLMHFIASANPEIFQGELSVDRICINVEDQGTMSFNAYAWPSGRSITILPSVILSAQSDAEVAGILAHELAHITMAHGDTWAHPKLDLQDWNNALNELVDKQIATMSDKNAIDESYKKYQERRRKLMAPIDDYLDKQFSNIRDSKWLMYFSASSSLLRLNKGRNEARKSYAELVASDAWYQLDNAAKESISRKFETAQLQFLNQILTLERQLITSTKELDSLEAKWKQEVDGFISAKLPRFLKKEWQQNEDKLAEARAKKRSLDQEEAQFYDQLMADVSKRNQVRRIDSYNWEEAEADELGLIYFLKSGFNHASFGKFFQNVMTPDEAQNCDQRLAQGRAFVLTQIPPRGRNTHPNSCYRIYDMMILMPYDYGSPMVDLIEGGTEETVFPGRLHALK